MATKKSPQRKIDTQPAITGGGVIIEEVITNAPPAIPTIPAPSNLQVTGQVIAKSAQSSQVYVNLSWDAPDSMQPTRYLIEYGKTSDYNATTDQFSSSIKAYTDLTNASVLLDTGIDYTFRVLSEYSNVQSDWSNIDSVTTNTDTTESEQIINLAASFSNIGDLIISWNEPSDPVYKDTEIKIYNSDKTVLYTMQYITGGSYIFTRADNFRLSSNAGITGITIVGTARSWHNVLTDPVVETTATSVAPTVPANITQSWSGDDGSFDSNVLFTWDAITGVASYDIEIDGFVKNVLTNSYLYTFDENKRDHANTIGDHTLAYRVRARNYLNQTSAYSSSTSAINAAPSNSFFNISTVAAFNTISVIITTSTVIKDLLYYEIRLKQSSTTLQTVTTTTNIISIDVGAAGTYNIEVYAVDVFGRYSAADTATGITIDYLTIAKLRSNLTYSDSVGNTNFDSLRNDVYNTGGISYVSGVTHSITATRELTERIRDVTVSIDSTGTTNWYLRTSNDNGITWRYFSGPLVSTGSTGISSTLTEYVSQTTANTNAIAHTALGNATLHKVTLPAIVEARTVELFVRNASNTINVREFYPRRLVQTDDIEAEAIQAINIAAGAVVASKISVTSLAAVTTNTGTLTINSGGYLRSGQLSYDVGIGFYLGNDGGVPKFSLGNGSGTKLLWDNTNLILQGSGFIIRTDTNPANPRIEFTSTGITGYNGGIEQVKIRTTDGKLVAGGGAVFMDSRGVYTRPDVVSDMRVGGYQLVGSDNKTFGLFTGIYNGVGSISSTTIGLYDEGLEWQTSISMYKYADSSKEIVMNNNTTVNGTMKANQVQSTGFMLASTDITSNVGNITASAGYVSAANGLRSKKTANEAVWTLDADGLGSTVTVANGVTTATPFTNNNNFSGMFLVQNDSTGAIALFMHGQNVMSLIAQSSAVYSASFGTASRVNIYSASGVVAVDNRSGASVTLRFMTFRIRAIS